MVRLTFTEEQTVPVTYVPSQTLDIIDLSVVQEYMGEP